MVIEVLDKILVTKQLLETSFQEHSPPFQQAFPSLRSGGCDEAE
jgi:hypothetical protein